MKQFYQSFKSHIVIVIFAIIACAVIAQSFKENIDAWYIIIPVILLGVIGVLSYNLKKSYGKTFGITGFLIFAIIILTGQYVFCKYFPVTTDTIVSNRKNRDLNNFDDFKPSMDAKIHFTRLQKENDSLTSLQVSYMRQGADTSLTKSIGQRIDKNISTMLDMAKAIEKNDNLYKDIQNFLFKHANEKKEESNESDKQENNQYSDTKKEKVFHLKKGERKTLLSFPDESKIIFESSGDFSVVERTTYDYQPTKEDMIGKTAGINSHYFKWGGKAVVVAEDDISIRAWIE
ncbi:hypothetical protein IPN41_03270 [Candidatus Falkowbacteria bacterium]|nr:MAG: hypothetical protein IPN41_03270 [Candidatus Falkowbacteria bacterium]